MRERGTRDGAALVVVLLILAATTYLIMESGKIVRIDYGGAAYERSLVVGGSLLRGGVLVAQELLLDDARGEVDGSDHLFEDWAKADKYYTRLSSKLDSGEIEAAIVAEDSKISVNCLNSNDETGQALRDIFLRLVGSLCEAHSIDADPRVFLQSIRIWLGAKDEQGDKVWYAEQDPSYSAGGRLRVPDELLLIRWKGVSSENLRKLYYGADGIPGLREFVTVWGDGRINVNVASREIVAAIVSEPNLRNEFVEAIESYRKNGSNLFSGPWYVAIAKRIGIRKKFPEHALTFKSRFFRVFLTVSVGASKMHALTILKREKKNCRVQFENVN